MPISAQEWRVRTGMNNAGKGAWLSSRKTNHTHQYPTSGHTGKEKLEKAPNIHGVWLVVMVTLVIPLLYRVCTMMLMVLEVLLHVGLRGGGGTTPHIHDVSHLARLDLNWVYLNLGHLVRGIYSWIASSTGVAIFTVAIVTIIVATLVVCLIRSRRKTYKCVIVERDGKQTVILCSFNKGLQGVSSCRGVCLVVLCVSLVLMILTAALLLIRCGDVETNPGPMNGDTSELLVNGAAFKLIIITILLAAVILMLVWFCNNQKLRNKTSARNLPSVIQAEAIACQQVSERESIDLDPQVSERNSLDQDPRVSLADRRLMPNDLHQVYTEVYATRPKWLNIGLAFNLSPATLESIKIKHREDPDSCLREMLYTRLKLEHPLTWRDVVNGLRCSTVGETALSNKLATKYGLEQNNSPELETCTMKAALSGRPTFDELCSLPIEKVWYPLGLWLGVEERVLQRIKQRHLWQPHVEMFRAFLDDIKNTHQYKQVIIALPKELKEVAKELFAKEGPLEANEFELVIGELPSENLKVVAKELLAKKASKTSSKTYGQLVRALVKVGKRKVAEEIFANKGISLTDYLLATDPASIPPECVVRYSSYLKDRYKQMSVLPDPDWPPAITTEQHYTNLALIERERHGHPGEETSETMAYDYAHGKIDNIVARKQKIQLEDVFLPIIGLGSKESRMTILMDGAPGVGKTTISRKVCIDWANGELLQEYQLVILVPLREVILTQTGHQSIADLLPADSNKLKDQVVQHIEEACGAEVLFIFDGFDELSSQQRNVQSLFLDIIKGSKLHSCSVLVTSRPYASGSLRRINRVNRHIEVLGFTEKQIDGCIHKNVPKIKAEQLIQKLKERLDIGSICYIPLNCRIVLFVYSQQQYTLPATLTQLYEVFILHTLKHHAGKITRDPTIIEEIQEASDIHSLPQSVQTQLDSLSQMAFSGIDKDQLVFSNEELKTSTNVLSLGLLNAIETFTISGSRRLFQFLHLTIQEFLAARHIASGVMSAVEKAVFIKSHINNESFRMTLLFLSGLTHLSFLPPGEPLLGSQINSAGNKFMFLAQLFYESNDSSSQWLLSSLNFKVFNMSDRLSQFDCLVLAHFFSSTPQDHVWEAINFVSCKLCLEILLSKYHSSEPGVPAVTLTKTINVSSISVTGPSVVSLFTGLERNTCLKTLTFSNNKITTGGEHSEAVGQAIEGMLGVNQSLQVLELTKCNLDDTVFGHIATGLTHNTTLQELDIGNNLSVTSDGWVQLFQTIQKGTTSLQKLDISVSNLQSEGVIALSQMLLLNMTITALSIRNISGSATITTEAWIKLFQGLQQLPTLNISKNYLRREGSIALGECLHHNKTITVLKARTCGLTDDVLKAMATNLSHESSSLREIDIGDNNSLTSEGWIPFFQILQQNSSLRKLNVRDSYKLAEVDRRGKVVTALAEMISCNKGIHELNISGEFIENEHKLLARSLVQNTTCTLQVLSVYSVTDLNDKNIIEEEIKKLKQEEGIVPPDCMEPQDK